MREVAPSVTIAGIVLAHGSPLAPAKVRSPKRIAWSWGLGFCCCGHKACVLGATEDKGLLAPLYGFFQALSSGDSKFRDMFHHKVFLFLPPKRDK